MALALWKQRERFCHEEQWAVAGRVFARGKLAKQSRVHAPRGVDRRVGLWHPAGFVGFLEAHGRGSPLGRALAGRGWAGKLKSARGVRAVVVLASRCFFGWLRVAHWARGCFMGSSGGTQPRLVCGRASSTPPSSPARCSFAVR